MKLFDLTIARVDLGNGKKQKKKKKLFNPRKEKKNCIGKGKLDNFTADESLEFLESDYPTLCNGIYEMVLKKK